MQSHSPRFNPELNFLPSSNVLDMGSSGVTGLAPFVNMHAFGALESHLDRITALHQVFRE